MRSILMTTVLILTGMLSGCQMTCQSLSAADAIPVRETFEGKSMLSTKSIKLIQADCARCVYILKMDC